MHADGADARGRLADGPGTVGGSRTRTRSAPTPSARSTWSRTASAGFPAGRSRAGSRSSRSWPRSAASPATGPLRPGIRAAIGEADAAVRRAGRADPRLAGMGTTVVLAVGAGGEWAIAHVGDSRAYLFRDGRLRAGSPRTTTWPPSLVARGGITADEAQEHPARNVVTRTLGAGLRPEPDLRRSRPAAGRPAPALHGRPDRRPRRRRGSSACSTGSRSARACCRELVDLANDGGGPDNITVLVADV